MTCVRLLTNIFPLSHTDTHKAVTYPGMKIGLTDPRPEQGRGERRREGEGRKGQTEGWLREGLDLAGQARRGGH